MNTQASPQANHVIEEAKLLSLDELKSVSEEILEEIEDREWDRVLQSPEGEVDEEEEYQKALEAVRTDKRIKYIPGKSLAELFHR